VNAGPTDLPILSSLANRYAQEAAAWVASEIERLRNLSYHDLLVLEDQPKHQPMETADGKSSCWKRRSSGMTVDFIRAPGGSFVGE
jgi:hypothetical protein